MMSVQILSTLLLAVQSVSLATQMRWTLHISVDCSLQATCRI
jgi:hypothetical protein